MEALILLFGEFLFSLFGGLLVVLAEGVLLLFSSLFCLLGWRSKNRGEDRASAEAPPVSEKSVVIKQKLPKWMTIAQRVLVVVFVFTLIAALFINTIFFEPALRKITEVVGRRMDLELSFADATGSFLPGRMQLNDVVIQKGSGSGSSINLSVKKIAVQFSLFALLGKTAEIDVLEIEALSGTFTRSCNQGSSLDGPQPEALEARKRFVIEALRIHQSSLLIVDESEKEEIYTLAVTINQLEAIPLRSSFAVFDILFRANAEGSIFGQPFSIRTQAVPGGRSTKWKTGNLPVELLSHYVGTPFNLLQEGVVDVDVEDFWTLDSRAEIDTHWSLIFRDVVAAVPSTIEPWANVFAEPAVDYINSHGQNLSLSFDFTMNENEFRGAASLDATGLWNELSRALVKEVSSRLDISSDQLKSGVSSGFNRFKSFLDDKRKNKAEQSE